MNKNLELFLTFMKIGAFTFGGGYAMIPLIQREVCDNKHWLNEDDILEVVAIAESTPGPVAINAATFVGSRTAGTLGAVCATLGVVLPSFLIISLISFILKAFQESRAVQYAFMGIRAGVLALILKAVYTMFMATKKTRCFLCYHGSGIGADSFSENRCGVRDHWLCNIRAYMVADIQKGAER